jgi:glucose/arabinose dehydrogenase
MHSAAARRRFGAAVQIRVETVVSGLAVPWAIAFPPDGRTFLTERPGRVRVIEQGRLRPEPLATIADVEPIRGDFFFGNLRGECIIHVVLDGRRVLRQERLLEEQYGRIRDIAEDPAGLIYFSTSKRDGRGSPARADDRILRLIPVP